MIIIKYFWVFCLVVIYIVTWILVIHGLFDDINYVKNKYNKKGLDFVKEVINYNDGFITFILVHIIILFIISLGVFICGRG